MKWLARSKPDQNRAVIDPWTAVHLGTGLAFGLMNAPPLAAICGALAYEAIEQVAENRKWGKEIFESSGPETTANAITDMIVFAAGVWLGRRWNASTQETRPTR